MIENNSEININEMFCSYNIYISLIGCMIILISASKHNLKIIETKLGVKIGYWVGWHTRFSSMQSGFNPWCHVGR